MRVKAFGLFLLRNQNLYNTPIYFDRLLSWWECADYDLTK